MKKKIIFPIVLALSSTCICGCSFYSLLSSSESSQTSISISGDGSTTKQKMQYTINDYVDNMFFSVSNTPTLGNPMILVLPILFTDSDDFIDTDNLGYYRDMMFKAIFGTNEETGWYSVASYYKEESLGKCTLYGSVAPWYQSTYSYDSVKDSNATAEIIKKAVDNWKSENPGESKQYDTNNDGYLDGVIVIYGGPNYKNIDKYHGHPNNSNMWAYTSWVSNVDKNFNDPNVKNYIWASYDFMTNDVSHVNIDTHTYVHETGHLFGLDDYYDYNDSSRRWAGAFSMQDYNVGGHDPYSMLCYGWAEPYVPTESCVIEINPFVSSKDLILLTPEYTGSPFDEYLLVELYTPTGLNELDSRYAYNGNYPTGLNKAGIRLWHVDSRLADVTHATYKNHSDAGDGYRIFDKGTYTITSNIDKNRRYLIGPTNTDYDRMGSYNSYSTSIEEYRDYRLLDLIRRNDRFGTNRGTQINNSHLFVSGDSFDINNYSAYFVEYSGTTLNTKRLLNNRKSFPWTINFDYVGNDKAVISLTKNG